MDRVLIVGGGASGALVATQLLRIGRVAEVVVAEPRDTVGLGVAYDTTEPEHLLNVPAGRMSAFPDDPDHFRNWAGTDGDAFVSRLVYGQYLVELLRTAVRESPERVGFRHVRTVVADIAHTESGYTVTFGNGEQSTFDAVVIALGHGSPIVPPGMTDLPASPRVVIDVWRDPIDEVFDDIAIIGTGLTFYDIALSLLRKRPDARITAISRNGLLPQAHLPKRAPALPVPPSARVSAQAIREYLTAAGEQWREAQDGIRHDLQEIWSAFPDSEKAIFLDQHFRWWNSLRHRAAPAVDEAIAKAIDDGRIRIVTAGLSGVSVTDGSVRIGLDDGNVVEVEQLLNCTGYQLFSGQPLIDALVGSGFLKRGPLDLGIACDPQDLRLVNADGRPHVAIYGIGPVLVGELLETTAIPEIRQSAQDIAAAISNQVR